MQIPYHTKVSLQEYYENFFAHSIPDFSDKCPICGGADCATFLGYYIRAAICPITGFSVLDLPVLRYLCHDKGDVRVCDHITFSLLPHELVPFRQLSLNFMVKAVWFKVNKNLSFTRLIEVIEDELNHLDDVADFIKKDGPMVGDLKYSVFIFVCISECAFSITKKFTFQKIAGQGAAVHSKKNIIIPVAVGVQGSCNKFLAGSAFPANQDSGLGMRHFLDHGDYFFDLRAAADQLMGQYRYSLLP